MKNIEKAVEEFKPKIEHARTTGRLRCTAKSKQSGFQCKNWALEGKDKCKFHGGKSTGAKTKEGKEAVKLNALKHGIYTNKILTPEEYDWYVETMEAWTEEYKLDEPNQLVLDRALRNYLKQVRKDLEEFENGSMDNEKGVMIDHDSKFLRYIQALGLDRKFNVNLKKEEKQTQDLASLLSGLLEKE